jgi:23S rRNA U2552 (ribose-2'-O)-methylase RlmE/FtsJ
MESSMPTREAISREVFQKIFSFDTKESKLPSSDQLFVQCSDCKQSTLWDAKLEATKTRLNECKSKLDDKDINAWGSHTSFTSLSADVVRTLRRKFDIEMCTIAWTKMYEMLEKFSLIKPSDGKFRSVHLCEAPGAFICATNHYLRTRYRGTRWSWFAVSLNPYFEGNDFDAMLDDDRLIVHTFDNWYFGEDDTGNIMERANIEGVWRRAKEMGSVHLVTADGSIDCQSDPNDQETLTAPLHYCEMVTALGLLSKGGSFVLKMFTLFESSSITILFLLSCVFEKLHVFKPATSKAGNSEVYVVCQNYRPIPQEHLKVLLEHAGPHVFKNGVAIVSQQLVPKTFLSQAIECAVQFAEWQRTTIEENLRSFNNLTPERRRQITSIRNMVAQEWIAQFRIKKLDKRDRLVQKIDLTGSFRDKSGTMILTGKSRSGGGSLTDRLQRMEQKRKWQQMQDESKDLGDEHPSKRQKSNNDLHSSNSDSISPSSSFLSSSASPLPSPLPSPSPSPSPLPSPSPSPLPSPSPRESFSSNDSIGMKLMRKMGYQDGSGLGRNSQGITYPILLTVRESRTGLGYENRYDLSQMDKPEYWINDNLVPSWYNDNCSGFDIARLDKRVKKWKIRIGASFALVRNSRFCSETILSELQKERTLSWIWKDRTGFKELRKWLFPGDIVGKEFLGSKVVLKLAVMDKALNFVGTVANNVSKLYYAEMGPKSPASAYITWKKRSKNLAWDPVRVELPSDIDESNRTRRVRESVMVTTNQNGLDIFFGNLSSDEFRMLDTSAMSSNQIEQKTARRLVEEVLNAVNTLRCGGSFVCKVYDLNRRLSAGLVYIVNMIFKRITIVKPFVSCPVNPERFLVCYGFTGYSSELVAYLNKVLYEMDHCNKSHTILEIVPTMDLLESDLRNKLRWWNEVAAIRETYALKTIDKMYREHRIKEQDPNLTKSLAKQVIHILNQ